MEITKLHPRAEWLLRGAGQHKLVDTTLISPPTTRLDVARASNPQRNNPRIIRLKLGSTQRVVPLTPTKQEVPTTNFADD